MLKANLRVKGPCGMAADDLLRDNVLDWLLEPADPGVRYLTLRDVLHYAADDPTLTAAREAAHTRGPIATVLAAMDEPGYWIKPGPGYSPKYHGSAWSMILLGQLGASAAFDSRVARACAYLLDHALTDGGQFTYNARPSGTFDCLQGNLSVALLDMGCDDPRLKTAFEWMAQSVTGEGVAPVSDRHAPVRYHAYKCGPLFACGANNRLPCAWGAVKVMLAFGRWPAERRTPLMERAIAQGVDFLFSTDPALADYPSGYSDKPSSHWWKLGFPVFYVTDLLQNVEALVSLGYRDDPRLAHALDVIRSKRGDDGRWWMEYPYGSKTWGSFGWKGRPNKWVTLRALRVLTAA
jgi:hypothetical protein